MLRSKIVCSDSLRCEYGWHLPVQEDVPVYIYSVHYRYNAKVRFIAENFAYSQGSKTVQLSGLMYRYNEHSAEHLAFSLGPENGASRPTNDRQKKNI